LERHATHTSFIRDAIIGLADGLTVPFAVTAGLSSIGSTKLVILGGIAELIAGSLSMGLGAFLATVTDAHHFRIEEARERRQIVDTPELEGEILIGLLSKYELSREETLPILENFTRNPESRIKFMMDFELKLECPTWSRPWVSAITMGPAYLIGQYSLLQTKLKINKPIGGLIPMIPYFVTAHLNTTLLVSIGITGVMLVIFGYAKPVIIGVNRYSALCGSLETFLVGAVAAGASYGIVKAVNIGVK
ncbi:VIT family-domain-containing protein, partial [Mariannaea sp. PMI_226]